MKDKVQESLKKIVKDNDAVLLAVVNYSEDEDLQIEFAVNTTDEELFTVLVELFKNNEIKDEARKAILFSDYGKKDIDSLNLN